MASNRNVATPVAAIHHQDTRTNIPTEELRDSGPDERAPRLLTRATLAGPPTGGRQGRQDAPTCRARGARYIQEKIHPQAGGRPAGPARPPGSGCGSPTLSINELLRRLQRPAWRSLTSADFTSTRHWSNCRSWATFVGDDLLAEKEA